MKPTSCKMTKSQAERARSVIASRTLPKLTPLFTVDGINVRVSYDPAGVPAGTAIDVKRLDEAFPVDVASFTAPSNPPTNVGLSSDNTGKQFQITATLAGYYTTVGDAVTYT